VKHWFGIFCLLLFFTGLQAIDYIPLKFNQFHGHVESSIGMHFWSDHLLLRNLQVRSLVYTPWYMRLNAVIRSNDVQNLLVITEDETIWEDWFEPHVDELYLETIHQFKHYDWQLDASVKLGRTRFLRFPYYFQTARFDRIPGLTDIWGGADADYSGVIANADLRSPWGVGYHLAHINWLWHDLRDGNAILENYVYFAPDVHPGILELRWGDLARRTDPPGDTVRGMSMLLGASWRGFSVALLAEQLPDDTYLGLLVNFAPTRITNAIGRVRLDYTRAHQGFVFQVPFAQYNFGYAASAPPDAELVGEVTVDRAITFWRAGLMRNFYEHVASRSGSIRGDVIVMKQEPWHLGFEGLITPYRLNHISITELKNWNNSTTRPGQYSQSATYYIYRRTH
jgi:hypothetical protein